MIIDYNMTHDYCSDWSAIDALREIVQNALDTGSAAEYNCDDVQICVYTPGRPLEPSMFALGASQKSGDAIGKYGEGFKIAMLVLTRMGMMPRIHTGRYTVNGLFREHEFTGVQSFCLSIEESVDVRCPGVLFTCDNNGIDLDELKNKVTPFGAQMSLPKTVDMLPSKPGMIFVNGLFVCKESKLSLGYNFAPSMINLNRDRNMTTGVEATLAQYFVKEVDAEIVFNLLENDAHDTSYVYIWLHRNKTLMAELARLFFNKYGEGAKIGKPGTSYVYSSGGYIACTNTQHSTYSICGIESATKVVDPESPLGIVESFVLYNKKHMRSKARTNAEQLVTQAKAWRAK